MRAAIFQPDAGPSTPEDRFARLDGALAAYTGAPLDLVVCPELFLSGFGDPDLVAARAEPREGPMARIAGAIARRHGVALVYGYPEATGGRLYNAALYISKNGTAQANHRKRALPTPYEESLFITGDSTTFFTLDCGLKAALLICYEAEFPEAVRACALAGAELVITPTALGTDWAVVSRKVIPSRAFENGVFMIYANYGGAEAALDYIGDSVIVSPLGEDLVRAGGGEALIAADIDRSVLPAIRKRLPFLRDYGSVT